MNKQELWQEYSINGTPLANGGLIARAKPSAPNAITGVAMVWLFRRTEQGIELLFQKRSQFVNRYAGDYDVSAGGHINYQESPVDGAIREALEEIGAKITPDDLHFLFSFAIATSLRYIFCVDWTNRPSEFHYSDQEVEQIVWVPLSQARSFISRYAKAPLAQDEIHINILFNWLKSQDFSEL